MPILRGPCYLTFGGQTILAKGGVTLNENLELFQIQSAMGGKIDDRIQSIMHTVTFELDGRVPTGALAVLLPYGASRVGQSVFSDAALVITDVNGKVRTYHNAAITSLPNLRLSTQATLLGSITFTCLHKSTDEISDANSLYTDSTASFTQPAQSAADIPTDIFTHAWGDTAPWDAFYSKEGTEVTFNLSLTTETDQRRGINTMTLSDITVSARLIPVGPTEAEVSAAIGHQGSGIRIGGTKSSANDLVISSDNVIVTLKNAAPTTNARYYDTQRRQQGELAWVANKLANTSGSPATLFTVANVEV